MHNTMHDIVVTGYDEGEGVAFIADNDRDEIQRCSLESLARARSSQAFPVPNRHATWVMRFPDELPEPRAGGRGGARGGAVENMRAGGASLASAPAARASSTWHAFAASYPDWPERFGTRSAPRCAACACSSSRRGPAERCSALSTRTSSTMRRRCSTIRGWPTPPGRTDSLASAWVALAEAAGTSDEPAAGARRGPGARRGRRAARVRGRRRDGAGRVGPQVSSTILPSLPPSAKRS